MGMSVQVNHLAQYRAGWSELFNDLYRLLTSFIVFENDDEPVVIVNWVIHTWLIPLFEYTPYLHLFSATKGCGKSNLLKLIAWLSSKGRIEINCTNAIYRTIDKNKPTLCFDEIDRYNSEDKGELWGVLNQGNEQSGAIVTRYSGPNNSAEEFDLFCPKAFSGIGREKLPDTLQDRSIPIALRRKLKEETTQRFRARKVRITCNEFVEVIERQVEEIADEDIFPDKLQEDFLEVLEEHIENDRAIDIAEPLLLIASLGDEDWLNRTTQSLINLSIREDEEDYNNELLLLKVCAEVMKQELSYGRSNIYSKHLVEKVNNSDTGRFGRYNNGLGIDQMFLAQKLKGYKIKTQSVRGDNSEGILKGYKFEDFEEPIARYLPNLSEVKEDPPEQDELFE
jgi:putative DNA primase/helicase